MNVPSVAHLIPVLQTAIGLMILISGLGLILLTMTNRLGGDQGYKRVAGGIETGTRGGGVARPIPASTSS